MYKKPGQWKLWQMVFLKKFLKRNMRPKTASQVNRYKLFASIGYFGCIMYFIHRVAFRAMPEHSGPGSDIKRAIDMNISDAKIIRFDGRKGTTEVIDFKREDYPELIENRSPYARE